MLPALARPGCTSILVSQYESLMHDKASSLKSRGVKSSVITCGASFTNVRRVLNGEFQHVFITPNLLFGRQNRDGWIDTFVDMAKGGRIVSIVVEGAHSIYKLLGNLHGSFATHSSKRKIPIIACTPFLVSLDVQKEMSDILCLSEDCLILQGSFNMENIHYSVRNRVDVETDLLPFCKSVHGSIIIFCISREECESISENISSFGVKCLCYHSHIPKLRRLFMCDEVNVMVTCLSNGSGIEKEDVRLVIHYGAPSSLQSYFTESSLAGRDGSPALSIIFHSSKDEGYQSCGPAGVTGESALRLAHSMFVPVIHYIYGGIKCRRRALLQELFSYWQEYDNENTKCCDVCDARTDSPPLSLVDFTHEAWAFVNVVHKTYSRFGYAKISKFLQGTDDLKVNPGDYDGLYGIARLWESELVRNAEWWRLFYYSVMITCAGLVKQSLRISNTIRFKGGVYEACELTEKGVKLLSASASAKGIVVVPVTPSLRSMTTPTPNNSSSSSSMLISYISDEGNEALRRLYSMRSALAKTNGTLPQSVCTKISLNDMVLHKPKSKDALKKIRGMGTARSVMFGDLFCMIMKQELVSK